MPIKSRPFIAAVISGLLLTAAFPKWNYDLLIWVGLVPLFWSLRGQRPLGAFLLGWVSGLAHYLTLIYWIYYVTTLYGGLPGFAAVAVLLLFSCYLALFPAFFCMVVVYIREKTALNLLAAAPFIWVGLELLRSCLFTGFPWELLGYAVYQHLHLIQISDLAGVYGVSFVIVAVNVALYKLLCEPVPWRKKIVSAEILAAFLMVAGLWVYGEFRLQHIEGITISRRPIKVALAQGNIDQSLKWNPAYQRKTIDIYKNLSEKALQKGPDLVVWPETAMPFYFVSNRELTRIVTDFVKKSGTYFLLGSPSFIKNNGDYEYKNRAFLLSPEGQVIDYYDKFHLVPYGEYVPLRRWFPFLGKIVPVVSDFSPGIKGKTLRYPDGVLGVLICFEGIFPYLSRSETRNGAQLLVNITNDAWFGKSSAPYQHLSMLVFRAVENRRYAVRAANTGISAVIGADGSLKQQSPLFERYLIQGSVPLMRDETLYSRFGDIFAYACALFAIIIFVWAVSTKTKNQVSTITERRT